MLLPNTILRDRYRIIHELGHGGMGTVYQAMDENLSCVVAVKETLADNDEQRRAFKREAQLLANLSHPTLPRVMDHFTHREGEFLVMQFVPGHDLAELLELREQPFATAKVLDWADQILDALEELHSSKPPIIHRDIKPSNLKVTPKGRVMLLDFGLAKGAAGQMSTADAESHGKSMYGYTPNYAPLEQIRGAGTDARSDIYSLAATLWALLTAHAPPDALTRIGEKDDGNPDPLRLAGDINPVVPKAVSAILNQAMAVNRKQRYGSATELRDELRKAQAEFERPTLRKQRQDRLEVGAPLSFPSQIATTGPPGPPSIPSLPVSTIKSLEPESTESLAGDQELPLTREIPRFPGYSERVVGSPTATSQLGDKHKQGKKRKRIAVAAVSILTIIAMGFLTFIVWRGSTRQPKVNGDESARTSTIANTAGLSKSSTNEPAIPPGMVYVAGGKFSMGRDDGDQYERPAHIVSVHPFFIDVYEVTNEEYLKFIQATGNGPPSTWIPKFDEWVKAGKPKVSYPVGTAKRPVTGITWDDANAYAHWADKRLPTEEEWEFAARGTDNRLYPWGDRWIPNAANAGKPEAGPEDGASGMADVGTYKATSPNGVCDMIGNAWEWTASNLKAYPGGSLPHGLSRDLKVLRGGSWASQTDKATVTFRRGYEAKGEKRGYSYTGFRLVRDIGKTSSNR